MQTTGNTILITGGTSGISLAFAEESIRLENKVIWGHRENPLNKFLTEAMEAIKNHVLQAPVEGSKNLREKREANCLM